MAQDSSLVVSILCIKQALNDQAVIDYPNLRIWVMPSDLAVVLEAAERVAQDAISQAQ